MTANMTEKRRELTDRERIVIGLIEAASIAFLATKEMDNRYSRTGAIGVGTVFGAAFVCAQLSTVALWSALRKEDDNANRGKRRTRRNPRLSRLRQAYAELSQVYPRLPYEYRTKAEQLKQTVEAVAERQQVHERLKVAMRRDVRRIFDRWGKANKAVKEAEYDWRFACEALGTKVTWIGDLLVIENNDGSRTPPMIVPQLAILLTREVMHARTG